jgi:hypothetical protein
VEGNTKKSSISIGVLPELARAIHLDVLLELARAIHHVSDGIFLCIALHN